jgi:hypothetical protein
LVDFLMLHPRVKYKASSWGDEPNADIPESIGAKC